MLSSHPEMCFRYRNNVCANIKVTRYLLSKVEKGPFNRNQTLKFNVLESRKICLTKSYSMVKPEVRLIWQSKKKSAYRTHLMHLQFDRAHLL